jgi:hypothetical protein
MSLRIQSLAFLVISLSSGVVQAGTPSNSMVAVAEAAPAGGYRPTPVIRDHRKTPSESWSRPRHGNNHGGRR